MKRILGSLAGALGKSWTWLRRQLRLGKVCIITLATGGALLVTSSGTVRADDATNLELWKQQARINALLTQRLDAVERRVGLLEQKTPTAYTPGYTPPAPSYTPSYTPAYVAPCTTGSCASSNSSLPLPLGYYQGYGGNIPK